jgi:hypothetical protein
MIRVESGHTASEEKQSDHSGQPKNAHVEQFEECVVLRGDQKEQADGRERESEYRNDGDRHHDERDGLHHG